MSGGSAYDALPVPVLALLLAVYLAGFVASTALCVLALAQLFGRVTPRRPAWLFGTVERMMAVGIGIGLGLVLIDQGVKAVWAYG